MRAILIAASLVSGGMAATALAACGRSSDPTKTASTELGSAPTPSESSSGSREAAESAPAQRGAGNGGRRLAAPLPQRLNCLRERNAAVVIAHRGGPNRDHPENAIETMERSLKAGALAMEVDVATSKDGVLFLMHDDTLDRTTSLSGEVSETPWADIEAATLEAYSNPTAFRPPTLEAALDWAVRNDVLLELDKKRATAFPPLIAAVRKARAENHVFLITYTDAQAVEVHAAAPDLVITATIRDLAQLDSLLKRGVRPETLVAWTGVETPDPTLWKALAERGIETAFGTLGERGTRLDDVYWQDRDASEYEALARDGLTFIATDVSDRVSRQLAARQKAAAACGF